MHRRAENSTRECGQRKHTAEGISDIQLLMSDILSWIPVGHTYVGTKAFLKGWKSGFFVKFGQVPWSWIRIRILIADPNPGESN
jgi:hypothetical protein